MVDTPGTTALTEEQQDELEQLTGYRYHHVQDGAHGPIVFQTRNGQVIPNNRQTRRRLERQAR